MTGLFCTTFVKQNDTGLIANSYINLYPRSSQCPQVGADFSSTVLNHMNLFGRMAICGSISTYNDKEPAKGKPSVDL